MSDSTEAGAALDRQLISEVLVRWGHARDADDWEALAACFHDDATIHISWISDRAKEFVRRSSEMATGRKPGEHTKHYIGGPWVIVNGDKAFSRCHVDLMQRSTIDGIQFDTETWSRFFDLFEKRDGQWRIFKRTAVYEKDRMDAVPPDTIPDGFFDGFDFSPYPAACRFLCFRQVKSGRTPMSNILSVYSDEEKALKAEGGTWVSGG